MGQSIAKTNSAQDVYANFSKVQNLDHPSMGNVILIKDKRTNMLYYLKKREYEANDAQATFNLIFDRSSIGHNNLVRLFGYLRVEDTDLAHEFASNTPGIALILEYAPHDLKEEVLKRSRIGKSFPEPEIWYLINSVATVCAYLQEQNIHHGDIRPRTILLTEEGKLKIFDEILVNVQQRRYRENVLYSPQALESFAQGTNKQYDLFKSDVFSFGMALLEIATMVDAREFCYDVQLKQIKFQAIDALLEKVRTTYSEKLFCLLVAVLQFDERPRLTWAQIGQYLQGQLNLPNPYTAFIAAQKNQANPVNAPPSPSPAVLTPHRMRPSTGAPALNGLQQQERNRSFTPNPTGRNDYFMGPSLLPGNHNNPSTSHSPMSLQKNPLQRNTKQQSTSADYFIPQDLLQQNLLGQMAPGHMQQQMMNPGSPLGPLHNGSMDFNATHTQFLQRTPTRQTINPIQPPLIYGAVPPPPPGSNINPSQQNVPQIQFQPQGQSKFTNNNPSQRVVSPQLNQMQSQGLLNAKQSCMFPSAQDMQAQMQFAPQPQQLPQLQQQHQFGLTAGNNGFFVPSNQDPHQQRFSYFGFQKSVNDPVLPSTYSTLQEEQAQKGFAPIDRQVPATPNVIPEFQQPLQGKMSAANVASPSYLLTRNVASPSSNINSSMQQTTFFMTSPTAAGMQVDVQANMANYLSNNNNSSTKNVLKTNQNFQNRQVISATKGGAPVNNGHPTGPMMQGPSSSKNATGAAAPKKAILKPGLQPQASNDKFSATTRANLKASNIQGFSSRPVQFSQKP